MTEQRLPAVIENPPLVPQLVRLRGDGWDGMNAWAMPQPRSGPQNNPNIATQVGGGVQIINGRAALAWDGSSRTYRALSLTPWVRAAIKIRREQISSAEWDIVPYEKEGRQNKRLAQRISDFLDTPNSRLISFHAFAQEVIEDLLVLDGAAIEKVRYPNGDMAELWPTPSEYIAVDEKWDGSAPDTPRYYYVPDGSVRATFKNTDMIYMMDNPRTISALGISPLRILLSVVDSELQAMEYNRRMVMGAPPNGALNIGDNALDSDVKRVKAELQSEVFGQSAMAVIGGYKSPSWMPFGWNNKDMQFREWQDLLIRCIAIVYGLSPMDLGITFDVNRSTATTQQENTEDRGQKPLMDLVQRYLTREVVWDESFGGRENNLQFRFVSLGIKETKQRADINKLALGSTPWKTVNEARVMDGREPIGRQDDEDNIFNHIVAQTPKGMLDITKGEYVGEQQLAELAADAKTAAQTAQDNADAGAVEDAPGDEAG